MNEREVMQHREMEQERANVKESNLYLIMTFKNTDGKSTSISLKYINPALTKADVEACMTEIINQNIFFTTGGDLVSIYKAQIVDKTTTTLG